MWASLDGLYVILCFYRQTIHSIRTRILWRTTLRLPTFTYARARATHVLFLQMGLSIENVHFCFPHCYFLYQFFVSENSYGSALHRVVLFPFLVNYYSPQRELNTYHARGGCSSEADFYLQLEHDSSPVGTSRLQCNFV